MPNHRPLIDDDDDDDETLFVTCNHTHITKTSHRGDRSEQVALKKNSETYNTVGKRRRKKENSTQTELLIGDQYENRRQKLLSTKST